MPRPRDSFARSSRVSILARRGTSSGMRRPAAILRVCLAQADPLQHREATVHAEHLTGDPGSPLAHEKRYGGGDIVWLTEASQRVHAQDCFLAARILLFDDVR